MQPEMKDLLRWESQSRGRGTPRDELKRERLVWHLVTVGCISPDSNVLSVGCGTGYYELNVRKSTNNLFCLDISRQMLAICKERGLRNLICGNALHLPLRHDVFDCVYALSITSVGGGTSTELTRLKTVQEMKRVAKKGGRIIIGHPTTIWKQVRSLLKYGHPNIELFRVSPEEVAAAYRRSNLKVLTSIIIPPLPYKVLAEQKYRKIDRIASRLLLNRLGPYLFVSGVK